MEQRGFAVTGLPNENKGDLGVTILNSAAFAEGISALKVESKSGEKLKYSLHNVQGYLIQDSKEFLPQIEIIQNTLPSGMYIINLCNEKGQVHSTRVLVY